MTCRRAASIAAGRPTIEAMRQAVLLTAPDQGSDADRPERADHVHRHRRNGRAVMTVLDTSATANADIVLDVVRLSDRGERFLRIRKTGEPDKPTHRRIGAGEPAAPAGVGRRASGRSAMSRMTMADGTPLGDFRRGARFRRRAGRASSSTRRNRSNIALAVTVSMPRRDIDRKLRRPAPHQHGGRPA